MFLLRKYQKADTTMRSDEQPLVLVVDDHIPAVGMLTRLLEREGYKVVSAYDGEQAVEICQRILPDLILLDVMMPKMNGFEVLKILRSNFRTENTPMILITAKNTPDDKQARQTGEDVVHHTHRYHPPELVEIRV